MKKILLLVALVAMVNSATISQKTYKQLQKAQDFTKKNQYKKAEEILEKIINSKTGDLGKSYAYRSLASLYIIKEQYQKVAQYYTKILNLEGFSKKEKEAIKLSLAQIYLSLEKYQKSLNYLESLIKSKTVDKAVLHENLSLAYYYNKQFRKSIPYCKKTLKTKKEKESWYRLLYSSHVELKDYKSAIRVLKTMIKLYGDKETYWVQLASIYSEVKQEKKALATLDAAYKKEILTQENAFYYYISFLLNHEIYNKPAKILEDLIKKGKLKNSKKSFELLVHAHLNGKNYQKAITTITTSKFANNDKYQLILGDTLYNQSRYQESIKALTQHQFLKKKTQGESYTLIALSYYNLENREKAKEFLQKASQIKTETRRAKNIAKELGIKI